VAELAKIKTPVHHNEARILRTLTIQMMLPFVYVLGIAMWLLDVTGIVKSATLRRSVITSASCVPLITPLITLYYLPTYKRYTYEKLTCLNNSNVDKFNSSINRANQITRRNLSFTQSAHIERIC
ncbi:hypothetical protein PFISCL1PPCAC_7110, partial [Pristionchus fissidentatus]